MPLLVPRRSYMIGKRKCMFGHPVSNITEALSFLFFSFLFFSFLFLFHSRRILSLSTFLFYMHLLVPRKSHMIGKRRCMFGHPVLTVTEALSFLFCFLFFFVAAGSLSTLLSFLSFSILLNDIVSVPRRSYMIGRLDVMQ